VGRVSRVGNKCDSLWGYADHTISLLVTVPRRYLISTRSPHVNHETDPPENGHLPTDSFPATITPFSFWTLYFDPRQVWRT
jgi:hypothetical protein